ncbi:MAG: hypothetical protein ACKO6F_09815 [Cyanobium sp.]
MRTTLTIEDTLLRQLRQKALDSGRPFKQVVNDTLRAGLEKSAEESSVVARPRYVCPTFSMGALAPGVDLTKANQMAAALEDEVLIEKLRQGR